MRHQIAFRQYNPKKPSKIWTFAEVPLNDARFPYTYKAVPYAGKPADGTGPYYINRTQGYVEYLVTETMKDTNLKEHSISTYRLYTSDEQAEWLLEHKITNVGTLLTNRIGIPAELKEVQNL